MSRIGLAAMAGFAIAFILGRKLRCDKKKKKTKNNSCLVIKRTKIVELYIEYLLEIISL